METEGRQAQSGAALVFARKPHQDRGTRRQEHRTAWLWFYYLCSQIWSSAPGRTDSRETLPDVNHVEGGNVLHRDRQYGHRRRERRRHQTAGWRLIGFLAVQVAVVLCGCHGQDLQATYSEAFTKFRQGESDAAFALAERAYRQSASSDPVWAWKFKILQAQVLLRKQRADEAAALLSPPVSSSLPASLVAQKYIVEAHALCSLNRDEPSAALMA